MQPRISLITLAVTDLERAKSFYEETLGWPSAPSPPGIVFFDLNGLILSLYPHADLVQDYGGEECPANSSGFTLAHNVGSATEVDALFARLRSHGATILKPPQKAFWGGYSGYFQDPDGHRWEIAHNPFWTIMSDGRISMQPTPQ